MEPQKKNNPLGEEKISKLLLKFSLPCILSLLVSALYNIVDQIFIGNSALGYLGNAATGIVFPITIIALAFAWCFGDGSAAYLSICQGRRDTQNAHQCIGTGITVTLLAGLLLMGTCFLWKEPILRLFGASDATVGLASAYFEILLPALPLYMLMNMMNAVIRADGSPGFSMASMTAGAVANIILDPLFIFGFQWGIQGAAYATVIGQVISFLISTLYFLTRTRTFQLTGRSFLPDFKVFRHAVTLGVSTFITQMSIVVISLTCNLMLSHYGALSVYGPDIPISVISIETKVFTVVINIVVGIILGGQPILGYNYGAKNYRRVKKTFQLVLLATLCVGVFSTLLFELCPQAVYGIFGVGSELYNEFAAMTFRIFLSLVTFTCVIKMSSIFLQAVGQPVLSAVVSLTRDIVCFVPLVILLPRTFGIQGILYAAPAADLIAAAVTAIALTRFFRTRGKDSAVTPEKDSVIRPTRQGLIVTIARKHGSAGKRVGQLVAERMQIPCYYKELTALAAQESGLDRDFVSELNENFPALLHELYLSTEVVQQAITAQAQIIQKIADAGSCVIVGRAADYVLRQYPHVVRVFIHAPREYRKKMVMEMYGDTPEEAARSLRRSDEARAAYYRNISNQEWGRAENYDLCIDGSLGPAGTAEAICAYLSVRAGQEGV